MRKEHEEGAPRLKAHIERDAEFIRKRFSATMRRHETDLRNPVSVTTATVQPVQVPSRVHEDFRRLRERAFYSDLEIDPQPVRTPLYSGPTPTSSGSAIGVIATECVLEHNLRLCGAMSNPRYIYWWGETDPPSDLDDKWTLDDLHFDEWRTAQKFVLTCDLPLGEPPDQQCSFVGTELKFKFVFPVGSPGRYCFYPLTTCLGNVAFTTSAEDPTPGYFKVDSYFTVSQNGNLLGGAPVGSSSTYRGLEHGDVVPISVDSHDFGYDSVSVDLDPDKVVAEVDVAILIQCDVGYNTDGSFTFDFLNQGGEIRCGSVKWGKNRPVVLSGFPH